MRTIIKAGRFTLRPYRKSDAASLTNNINDKTISRNTLGIPYPYTLKDAKQWIAKCLREGREKASSTILFVMDTTEQSLAP